MGATLAAATAHQPKDTGAGLYPSPAPLIEMREELLWLRRCPCNAATLIRDCQHKRQILPWLSVRYGSNASRTSVKALSRSST